VGLVVASRASKHDVGFDRIENVSRMHLGGTAFICSRYCRVCSFRSRRWTPLFSPTSHYGKLPALAAPAFEASKSLIGDSWYLAAHLVLFPANESQRPNCKAILQYWAESETAQQSPRPLSDPACTTVLRALHKTLEFGVSDRVTCASPLHAAIK
jgi:hypothetical protein